MFHKLWRFYTLCIGFTCLIVQAGHASNRSDLAFVGQNSTNYRPFATLMLDADYVQAGQAQTLTLFPPYHNHYTNAHAWTMTVDGGSFLGMEWDVSERLQAQLGIAGYVNSHINIKGDVWQAALPVFDNLSYAYHIQSTRVMMSSKLLTSLDNCPQVHPYVSGEIGAASNRASHYQETPLIEGVLPIIPFVNHSEHSLAYGVGLGIDYNISTDLRLGIGYQFADLGSASLGITPDALTTQTLNVSHLYTNQLRFQLTALF